LVKPVAGIVGATILLSVLLSGCGNSRVRAPDPSVGSPGVTEPSAPASDRTNLVIMVDDGAGGRTTWTLTCDPLGGSHPDPAAACRALEARGSTALPPVRKDVACTEIYGGPQRATITGTWQGRQVRSSFSRVNGCEISRWDQLKGLLPPGGL
jgi:Subtilisin inhibitor-like